VWLSGRDQHRRSGRHVPAAGPPDVTSGPGWAWDSRGWLQASSGAVVKNLIVSGPINVGGSNITVSNNKVLVSGENWGIGLQHSTNAIVSDNEIGILGGSPRLMVGIKDIYGDSSGFQILRNNIQNTQTGVQVEEGLIADNYIHDMGYAPATTSTAPPPTAAPP